MIHEWDCNMLMWFLTMLKAMAGPVQLLGGWGFIISWLYRGIGIILK